MSLLERIYFFHDKLTNCTYPNASTLAYQFEISLATARRDIAYLRDRLCAPIDYNQQKNGFYYTDTDFALPFDQSPGILFLLAMLGKIAKETGIAKLPEVQKLENRLGSLLFPDYKKLLEALHCEWIEVETIDSTIFSQITESIVQDHCLAISYRSIQGTTNSRTVEPVRLINYQGRWYLLAFCLLRQAFRIFHIARIITAEPGPDRTPRENGDPDLYLEQSFGIFKGKVLYEAEILFTGTAAHLVRHQHWHKNQQIEDNADNVILRLPVSDDREITMKILQYGSMARVISPPELCTRVAREIKEMAKIYEADNGQE